MECKIGVISGDGIGPEIVAEAKKVLDKIGTKYGHSFLYEAILMGGCSIDATGVPLTDEAIAANPSLGYYSDYNDGLVNLCQELGCTFIDNTSIVENSSENLYEPDGEHVIQTYYPKWLTHMAQIAGLKA